MRVKKWSMRIISLVIVMVLIAPVELIGMSSAMDAPEVGLTLSVDEVLAALNGDSGDRTGYDVTGPDTVTVVDPERNESEEQREEVISESYSLNADIAAFLDNVSLPFEPDSVLLRKELAEVLVGLVPVKIFPADQVILALDGDELVLLAVNTTGDPVEYKLTITDERGQSISLSTLSTKVRVFEREAGLSADELAALGGAVDVIKVRERLVADSGDVAKGGSVGGGSVGGGGGSGGGGSTTPPVTVDPETPVVPGEGDKDVVPGEEGENAIPGEGDGEAEPGADGDADQADNDTPEADNSADSGSDSNDAAETESDSVDTSSDSSAESTSDDSASAGALLSMFGRVRPTSMQVGGGSPGDSDEESADDEDEVPGGETPDDGDLPDASDSNDNDDSKVLAVFYDAVVANNGEGKARAKDNSVTVTVPAVGFMAVMLDFELNGLEPLKLDAPVVTFMAGGQEFGTQQVDEDGKVSPPNPAPDPEKYDMLVFRGWFESPDPELDASPFDFSKVIDADLTLYAWFDSQYLIQYKDKEYDGVVISSERMYAGQQIYGPTQDTLDKVLEQTPEDHTMDYWYLEGGDRDTPYYFNSQSFANSDMVFLPHFTNAYIVLFDPDGGTSVPTQLVTKGEYAAVPDPAPTREGFTFDGWVDKDGNAFEFATTPITGDTTLTATWIGTTVEYTVAIWMEKAGYEADFVPDPTKQDQYNYITSVKLQGTAGELTDLDVSSLENLDSEIAKLFDGTDTSTILRYATPQQVTNRTIQGNGLTVVNLYARRTVYTYEFDLVYERYTSRTMRIVADGTTYTNAQNAKKYTLEVKYEMDISDKFPVQGLTSVATFSSGFASWQRPGTDKDPQMTWLDSAGIASVRKIVDAGMLSKDGQQRTYTLTATWTATGSTAHYRYFVEAYPGEVLDDPGNPKLTIVHNGATYVLMEEYNQEYRHQSGINVALQAKSINGLDTLNKNHETYYYITSGTNKGTYTTSQPSWLSGIRYETHRVFRYSRTDQELRFDMMRPSSDTIINAPASPRTVKFGEPLTAYEPDPELKPTIEGSNLNFVGWYRDADYQQPFDWSVEMPIGGMVVYAKWESTDNMIRFLDARGGTQLDPDTYWPPQGVAHGSYAENQINVYWQPGETFIKGKGLFMGWYHDVSTRPVKWSWETVIYQDYTLYATWQTEGFSVVYDLAGGIGEQPLDNNKYAMNTTARVQGTNATKDGLVFYAWMEEKSGRLYYPGSFIDIGETGKVVLKAQYARASELWTLTYYAVDGNSAGLDKLVVSVNSANPTINLAGKIFEQPGNTLIGWSDKAYTDPSKEYYKLLGESYTLLGDDEELYGVWEESKATVTFYPGNGQLEGQSIFEGITVGTAWGDANITPPKAKPNNSNHYFAGWDPVLPADGEAILGNLHFTAKYDPLTDLTITADSASRPYNATPLTVDSYTATGLKEGHELVDVVLSNNVKTEASTQPYEVSIASYKIIDTQNNGAEVDYNQYKVTLNKGWLTITPRTLKLIGNSATVPYNGEVQTLSGYEIDPASDGLVDENGIQHKLNLVAETSGRLAGFYPLVIDIANATITDQDGLSVDMANYAITKTDGLLTINKPDGEGLLKWSIKVDPVPLVYDGFVHYVTHEVNFTFDGDYKLSPSTPIQANSTGRDAGEYKPTLTLPYDEKGMFTGVTILNAHNEDVTDYFANPHVTFGKLTIDKVPLKVKAQDKAIDFGDDAPEFTAIVTGYVGTDSPESIFGSENPLRFTTVPEYVKGESGPGTHVIEVDGDAKNYNITFEPGTLTVRAYSGDLLKVEAEGVTTTYNGQGHSIDVQFDHTIPGSAVQYSLDEMNWSTENPVFTEATSKEGITVHYMVSAPNYDSVIGSKQVIINRRPLVLTTGKVYETYTGETIVVTPPAVEKEEGMLVAGQTVTATSSGEGLNVGGPYYIFIDKDSVAIQDKDGNPVARNNYIIKCKPGELYIEARVIDLNKDPYKVTIDDAEKIYGDADPTFTFKSSPEFDTIKHLFDIELTRNDAGELVKFISDEVYGGYDITMTVTAKSQADAAGYNIILPEAPGKLTITPRPITLVTTSPTEPYTYTGDPIEEKRPVTLEGGGSLPFGDKHAEYASGEGRDVDTYPITIPNTIHDKDGNDATYNYKVTPKHGSFTIVPKEIDLTGDKYGVAIKSTGKPYGELDPDLTFESKPDFAEITALFEVSLSREAGEDVKLNGDGNLGYYPITMSLTPKDGVDPKNYDITPPTPGKFTITKRLVTLTGDSAERLYNGQTQEFSGYFANMKGEPNVPALEGLLPGHIITEGVSAEVSGKRPDTYLVKVEVDYTTLIISDQEKNVAHNYKFDFVDGKFTIRAPEGNEKLAWSITLPDESRTYNGFTQTYWPKATFDFAVDTHKWNGSYVSFASGKDVGYYEANNLRYSPTILDDDNVDVTDYYADPTINMGGLEITKRSLLVTALPKTMTYGDTELPKFTAIYLGLALPDTAQSAFVENTLQFSTNYNLDRPSPAGVYYINVTGESKNYDVTFVPSLLTVCISGELIASAGDVTHTYDGNAYGIDVQYGGVLDKTNVRVEYRVEGGRWTTTPPAFTEAGTYKVEYRVSAFNYKQVSGEATVTIKERPITLTTDNVDTVYNGFEQYATPEVKYEEGSLLSVHTLNATASGKGTDVGTHDIVITVNDIVDKNGKSVKHNYKIVEKPGSLRITPYEIDLNDDKYKVTIDSDKKIYGDSDPELGYSGWPSELEKDWFVIALERTPGEDVGVYDIKMTLTAVKDKPGENFVVTVPSTPGVFTIKQREITLNTESFTETFTGNPIVKEPVVTLEAGSTMAFNDVHAATARGEGLNVDVYPITIPETIHDGAGKDVTSNYLVTRNHGTLTIEAKAVTPDELKVVIGEDYKKTYADKDPDYNVITWDTALDIKQAWYTVTFDRDAGEDVDTYDITATFTPVELEDGSKPGANYTITAEPGKLTIIPREIEVTAFDRTRIYTGDEIIVRSAGKVTEGSLDGTLLTGHDIEVEATGSGTDVGDYNITIQSIAITLNQGTVPVNLNNYQIKEVPGTLTIKPRNVEPDELKVVIGEDYVKTYADKDPVYTVTWDPNSAIRQDWYDIDFERETGEDVETYEVTATFTPVELEDGSKPGANYTIKAEAGKLTIVPRAITVKADNASRAYTGSPISVTVETGTVTEGQLDGDLLTGHKLALVAIGTGTDAKEYPIEIQNNSIIIEDSLGKPVSGNYKIEAVDGTLTIHPDGIDIGKELGVTIQEATKVYADEDPRYELAGWDENASIKPSWYTVTFTRDAGENVGEYEVRATITPLPGTDGENYEVFLEGTGKLTIVPRAITVTADSAYYRYTGSPISVTVETGRVTEGQLDGTLRQDHKLNVTATGSGTSVGTYPINITELSIEYGPEGDKIDVTANYDITELPGVLTISRRNGPGGGDGDGGNGSGGGGNTNPPTSGDDGNSGNLVSIGDGDVPLTDMVNIDDGDVPLEELPDTGGVPVEAFMALGIVMMGSAGFYKIQTRKRYRIKGQNS